MNLNRYIHSPFYRNEDDPVGGFESSFEYGGQPESEETPEIVTREDFDAFAKGIASGHSPYNDPLEELYENPYDEFDGYSDLDLAYGYDDEDYDAMEPEFYDRESLSQHLHNRDQQLAANILASIMPMVAPAVAQTAANAIGGDLDSDSKTYILEKLSALDPHAIQGVMWDPTAREMLRGAAQHYALRQRGDSIPGASGIAVSGGYGNDGGQIESFMKAFGVTKQRATEIFQKALKENH